MEQRLERWGEAAQLERIARMELDEALTDARCLVWGAGEVAEALAERLTPVCRDCLTVCDRPPEPGEGDRFLLAVLFEAMEQAALERLMAPGGLVVDLAPPGDGDWTVYDHRLAFRRVRVLRLAGRRLPSPARPDGGAAPEA